MGSLSEIAQAALDQAKQRQRRSEACRNRLYWTAEEEQQLRDRYADELTQQIADDLGRSVAKVLAKANTMGLHKSESFLAEHGRRLNGKQGESSRFQKGQPAWNKGMKGLQQGGVETQFGKGHMPHNWVPIGTEQIRDGYLWRKVTDTRSRNDWKQVHVMLWEEHNGPIPKGLILVFKNGNRQRIELDNLELITRGELMQRNTIHRYPPELKDAIRVVGKLKRTIKKVERHEKQG